MRKINMKKILSIALIVIITTVFGGLLSYVNAFIGPAGQAPANNTPAPVNADSTGFFLKKGKLGVSDDRNANNKIKEIDANAFTDNVLVVMGQMSIKGALTANGQMRIRGELSDTSKNFPLLVTNNVNNIDSNTGRPTSLFNVNSNSTPLTFFTTDHTRVARIVAGSPTADPLTSPGYNLYVEPGSKATNLGTSNDYCTLTKDELKNKGCPTTSAPYNSNNPPPSYRSVYGPATYLGQVFLTSNSANSDIVAACYYVTPSAAPTGTTCY